MNENKNNKIRIMAKETEQSVQAQNGPSAEKLKALQMAMEKIEKKINGFLRTAILSMAGMIALGVVFMLAPAFMLSVLRWGIAIILTLAGVAMIARSLP